MKKIESQLILFMGLMLVFIVIILTGFFYGKEYPYVFFGALIVLAVGIFLLLIRPRMKDALSLLGWLFLSTIVFAWSDKFVNQRSSSEFVTIIILIAINAPLFVPCWTLFQKSIARSKIKQEIESEKFHK